MSHHHLIDSSHYAAARRSPAFLDTPLYNNKKKRKRLSTSSSMSFDYAEFAASLYRKHLPLDLRLDLQQWFTMKSRYRGAFGCTDKRWLDIAIDGKDHIDAITGVVGCAVSLLACGANATQSSLFEDLLVQELISTKWTWTPDGMHTMMSYCAVDDDRIAYICKYTIGGKCCGKQVNLAPPTQWASDHPHPTNHFVWREGKYMHRLHGSKYGNAFPFKGTNPRKDFYQCGRQGNMREYGHPSGHWRTSRHASTEEGVPTGRRCPGRLCDLERMENYWTWKTFIKYLVTDPRNSRTLSRFYKVVVLGSARLIQRRWRGYFARVCIVPFTAQTRASSPTCVVWSFSRATQELEWSKQWFEFLVARRCAQKK